ncbi:MAG: ABC transporter permease, partial [Desulfobacteraceae bacterium]|nr:ABC transporter permease [Desulfobacteraceae bacterium]
TIIFSVIFKAKFGNSVTESRVEFALALFCGLIPFNIFTECIAAAPRLIVANINYVKKVVFPLEILPVSIFGRSLINGLISFVILIISVIVFVRSPSWTLLYLPLVFLPLIFWSLGISFFLASLGVFIRDIEHAVGILIRVLFFLTPIFYPISAVPPGFRFILRLNPLTSVVSDFRRVIMWGQGPEWLWWGAGAIVSFLVMIVGYAWFMRGKHAFADVL